MSTVRESLDGFDSNTEAVDSQFIEIKALQERKERSILLAHEIEENLDISKEIYRNIQNDVESYGKKCSELHSILITAQKFLQEDCTSANDESELFQYFQTKERVKEELALVEKEFQNLKAAIGKRESYCSENLLNDVVNLENLLNELVLLSSTQDQTLMFSINEQDEYYERLEEFVLWMNEIGGELTQNSFQGKDLTKIKNEVIKKNTDYEELKEDGSALIDKITCPERRNSLENKLDQVDEEYENILDHLELTSDIRKFPINNEARNLQSMSMKDKQLDERCCSKQEAVSNVDGKIGECFTGLSSSNLTGFDLPGGIGTVSPDFETSVFDNKKMTCSVSAIDDDFESKQVDSLEIKAPEKLLQMNSTVTEQVPDLDSVEMEHLNTNFEEGCNTQVEVSSKMELWEAAVTEDFDTANLTDTHEEYREELRNIASQENHFYQFCKLMESNLDDLFVTEEYLLKELQMSKCLQNSKVVLHTVSEKLKEHRKDIEKIRDTIFEYTDSYSSKNKETLEGCLESNLNKTHELEALVIQTNQEVDLLSQLGDGICSVLDDLVKWLEQCDALNSENKDTQKIKMFEAAKSNFSEIKTSLPYFDRIEIQEKLADIANRLGTRKEKENFCKSGMEHDKPTSIRSDSIETQLNIHDISQGCFGPALSQEIVLCKKPGKSKVYRISFKDINYLLNYLLLNAKHFYPHCLKNENINIFFDKLNRIEKIDIFATRGISLSEGIISSRIFSDKIYLQDAMLEDRVDCNRAGIEHGRPFRSLQSVCNLQNRNSYNNEDMHESNSILPDDFFICEQPFTNYCSDGNENAQYVTLENFEEENSLKEFSDLYIPPIVEFEYDDVLLENGSHVDRRVKLEVHDQTTEEWVVLNNITCKPTSVEDLCVKTSLPPEVHSTYEVDEVSILETTVEDSNTIPDIIYLPIVLKTEEEEDTDLSPGGNSNQQENLIDVEDAIALKKCHEDLAYIEYSSSHSSGISLMEQKWVLIELQKLEEKVNDTLKYLYSKYNEREISFTDYNAIKAYHTEVLSKLKGKKSSLESLLERKESYKSLIQHSICQIEEVQEMIMAPSNLDFKDFIEFLEASDNRLKLVVKEINRKIEEDSLFSFLPENDNEELSRPSEMFYSTYSAIESNLENQILFLRKKYKLKEAFDGKWHNINESRLVTKKLCQDYEIELSSFVSFLSEFERNQYEKELSTLKESIVGEIEEEKKSPVSGGDITETSTSYQTSPVDITKSDDDNLFNFCDIESLWIKSNVEIELAFEQDKQITRQDNYIKYEVETASSDILSNIEGMWSKAKTSKSDSSTPLNVDSYHTEKSGIFDKNSAQLEDTEMTRGDYSEKLSSLCNDKPANDNVISINEDLWNKVEVAKSQPTSLDAETYCAEKSAVVDSIDKSSAQKEDTQMTCGTFNEELLSPNNDKPASNDVLNNTEDMWSKIEISKSDSYTSLDIETYQGVGMCSDADSIEKRSARNEDSQMTRGTCNEDLLSPSIDKPASNDILSNIESMWSKVEVSKSDSYTPLYVETSHIVNDCSEADSIDKDLAQQEHTQTTCGNYCEELSSPSNDKPASNEVLSNIEGMWRNVEVSKPDPYIPLDVETYCVERKCSEVDSTGKYATRKEESQATRGNYNEELKPSNDEPASNDILSNVESMWNKVEVSKWDSHTSIDVESYCVEECSEADSIDKNSTEKEDSQIVCGGYNGELLCASDLNNVNKKETGKIFEERENNLATKDQSEEMKNVFQISTSCHSGDGYIQNKADQGEKMMDKFLNTLEVNLSGKDTQTFKEDCLNEIVREDDCKILIHCDESKPDRSDYETFIGNVIGNGSSNQNQKCHVIEKKGIADIKGNHEQETLSKDNENKLSSPFISSKYTSHVVIENDCKKLVFKDKNFDDAFVIQSLEGFKGITDSHEFFTDENSSKEDFYKGSEKNTNVDVSNQNRVSDLTMTKAMSYSCLIHENEALPEGLESNIDDVYIRSNQTTSVVHEDTCMKNFFDDKQFAENTLVNDTNEAFNGMLKHFEFVSDEVSNDKTCLAMKQSDSFVRGNDNLCICDDGLEAIYEENVKKYQEPVNEDGVYQLHNEDVYLHKAVMNQMMEVNERNANTNILQGIQENASDIVIVTPADELIMSPAPSRLIKNVLSVNEKELDVIHCEPLIEEEYLVSIDNTYKDVNQDPCGNPATVKETSRMIESSTPEQSELCEEFPLTETYLEENFTSYGLIDDPYLTQTNNGLISEVNSTVFKEGQDLVKEPLTETDASMHTFASSEELIFENSRFAESETNIIKNEDLIFEPAFKEDKKLVFKIPALAESPNSTVILNVDMQEEPVATDREDAFEYKKSPESANADFVSNIDQTGKFEYTLVEYTEPVLEDQATTEDSASHLVLQRGRGMVVELIVDKQEKVCEKATTSKALSENISDSSPVLVEKSVFESANTQYVSSTDDVLDEENSTGPNTEDTILESKSLPKNETTDKLLRINLPKDETVTGKEPVPSLSNVLVDDIPYQPANEVLEMLCGSKLASSDIRSDVVLRSKITGELPEEGQEDVLETKKSQKQSSLDVQDENKMREEALEYEESVPHNKFSPKVSATDNENNIIPGQSDSESEENVFAKKLSSQPPITDNEAKSTFKGDESDKNIEPAMEQETSQEVSILNIKEYKADTKKTVFDKQNIPDASTNETSRSEALADKSVLDVKDQMIERKILKNVSGIVTLSSKDITNEPSIENNENIPESTISLELPVYNVAGKCITRGSSIEDKELTGYKDSLQVSLTGSDYKYVLNEPSVNSDEKVILKEIPSKPVTTTNVEGNVLGRKDLVKDMGPLLEDQTHDKVSLSNCFIKHSAETKENARQIRNFTDSSFNDNILVKDLRDDLILEINNPVIKNQMSEALMTEAILVKDVINESLGEVNETTSIIKLSLELPTSDIPDENILEEPTSEYKESMFENKQSSEVSQNNSKIFLAFDQPGFEDGKSNTIGSETFSDLTTTDNKTKNMKGKKCFADVQQVPKNNASEYISAGDTVNRDSETVFINKFSEKVSSSDSVLNEDFTQEPPVEYSGKIFENKMIIELSDLDSVADTNVAGELSTKDTQLALQNNPSHEISINDHKTKDMLEQPSIEDKENQLEKSSSIPDGKINKELLSEGAVKDVRHVIQKEKSQEASTSVLFTEDCSKECPVDGKGRINENEQFSGTFNNGKISTETLSDESDLEIKDHVTDIKSLQEVSGSDNILGENMKEHTIASKKNKLDIILPSELSSADTVEQDTTQKSCIEANGKVSVNKSPEVSVAGIELDEHIMKEPLIEVKNLVFGILSTVASDSNTSLNLGTKRSPGKDKTGENELLTEVSVNSNFYNQPKAVGTELALENAASSDFSESNEKQDKNEVLDEHSTAVVKIVFEKSCKKEEENREDVTSELPDNDTAIELEKQLAVDVSVIGNDENGVEETHHALVEILKKAVIELQAFEAVDSDYDKYSSLEDLLASYNKLKLSEMKQELTTAEVLLLSLSNLLDSNESTEISEEINLLQNLYADAVEDHNKVLFDLQKLLILQNDFEEDLNGLAYQLTQFREKNAMAETKLSLDEITEQLCHDQLFLEKFEDGVNRISSNRIQIEDQLPSLIKSELIDMEQELKEEHQAVFGAFLKEQEYIATVCNSKTEMKKSLLSISEAVDNLHSQLSLEINQSLPSTQDETTQEKVSNGKSFFERVFENFEDFCVLKEQWADSETGTKEILSRLPHADALELMQHVSDIDNKIQTVDALLKDLIGNESHLHQTINQVKIWSQKIRNLQEKSKNLSSLKTFEEQYKSVDAILKEVKNLALGLGVVYKCLNFVSGYIKEKEELCHKQTELRSVIDEYQKKVKTLWVSTKESKLLIDKRKEVLDSTVNEILSLKSSINKISVNKPNDEIDEEINKSHIDRYTDLCNSVTEFRIFLPVTNQKYIDNLIKDIGDIISGMGIQEDGVKDENTVMLENLLAEMVGLEEKIEAFQEKRREIESIEILKRNISDIAGIFDRSESTIKDVLESLQISEKLVNYRSYKEQLEISLEHCKSCIIVLKRQNMNIEKMYSMLLNDLQEFYESALEVKARLYMDAESITDERKRLLELMSDTSSYDQRSNELTEKFNDVKPDLPKLEFSTIHEKMEEMNKLVQSIKSELNRKFDNNISLERVVSAESKIMESLQNSLNISIKFISLGTPNCESSDESLTCMQQMKSDIEEFGVLVNDCVENFVAIKPRLPISNKSALEESIENLQNSLEKLKQMWKIQSEIIGNTVVWRDEILKEIQDFANEFQELLIRIERKESFDYREMISTLQGELIDQKIIFQRLTAKFDESKTILTTWELEKCYDSLRNIEKQINEMDTKITKEISERKKKEELSFKLTSDILLEEGKIKEGILRLDNFRSGYKFLDDSILSEVSNQIQVSDIFLSSIGQKIETDITQQKFDICIDLLSKEKSLFSVVQQHFKRYQSFRKIFDDIQNSYLILFPSSGGQTSREDFERIVEVQDQNLDRLRKRLDEFQKKIDAEQILGGIQGELSALCKKLAQQLETRKMSLNLQYEKYLQDSCNTIVADFGRVLEDLVDVFDSSSTLHGALKDLKMLLEELESLGNTCLQTLPKVKYLSTENQLQEEISKVFKEIIFEKRKLEEQMAHLHQLQSAVIIFEQHAKHCQEVVLPVTEQVMQILDHFNEQEQEALMAMEELKFLKYHTASLPVAEVCTEYSTEHVEKTTILLPERNELFIDELVNKILQSALGEVIAEEVLNTVNLTDGKNVEINDTINDQIVGPNMESIVCEVMTQPRDLEEGIKSYQGNFVFNQKNFEGNEQGRIDNKTDHVDASKTAIIKNDSDSESISDKELDIKNSSTTASSEGEDILNSFDMEGAIIGELIEPDTGGSVDDFQSSSFLESSLQNIGNKKSELVDVEDLPNNKPELYLKEMDDLAEIGRAREVILEATPSEQTIFLLNELNILRDSPIKNNKITLQQAVEEVNFVKEPLQKGDEEDSIAEMTILISTPARKLVIGEIPNENSFENEIHRCVDSQVQKLTEGRSENVEREQFKSNNAIKKNEVDEESVLMRSSSNETLADKALVVQAILESIDSLLNETFKYSLESLSSEAMYEESLPEELLPTLKPPEIIGNKCTSDDLSGNDEDSLENEYIEKMKKDITGGHELVSGSMEKLTNEPPEKEQVEFTQFNITEKFSKEAIIKESETKDFLHNKVDSYVSKATKIQVDDQLEKENLPETNQEEGSRQNLLQPGIFSKDMREELMTSAGIVREKISLEVEQSKKTDIREEWVVIELDSNANRGRNLTEEEISRDNPSPIKTNVVYRPKGELAKEQNKQEEIKEEDLKDKEDTTMANHRQSTEIIFNNETEESKSIPSPQMQLSTIGLLRETSATEETRVTNDTDTEDSITAVSEWQPDKEIIDIECKELGEASLNRNEISERRLDENLFHSDKVKIDDNNLQVSYKDMKKKSMENDERQELLHSTLKDNDQKEEAVAGHDVHDKAETITSKIYAETKEPIIDGVVAAGEFSREHKVLTAEDLTEIDTPEINQTLSVGRAPLELIHATEVPLETIVEYYVVDIVEQNLDSKIVPNQTILGNTTPQTDPEETLLEEVTTNEKMPSFNTVEFEEEKTVLLTEIKSDNYDFGEKELSVPSIEEDTEVIEVAVGELRAEPVLIIDGNDLAKNFGVLKCSDNNSDNQILDEASEESSILLEERPQTLVLPARETSLPGQLEKQQGISKEYVEGETKRENLTHVEQNLIGKEISKRELTNKEFPNGGHSNKLIVVPVKVDGREGTEKRKRQEAKRAEVSEENNTEDKLFLKTKDYKSNVFATSDTVSSECCQGIENQVQDESVFQSLNTEVVKLTELSDKNVVSATYQVESRGIINKLDDGSKIEPLVKYLSKQCDSEKAREYAEAESLPLRASPLGASRADETDEVEGTDVVNYHGNQETQTSRIAVTPTHFRLEESMRPTSLHLQKDLPPENPENHSNHSCLTTPYFRVSKVFSPSTENEFDSPCLESEEGTSADSAQPCSSLSPESELPEVHPNNIDTIKQHLDDPVNAEHRLAENNVAQAVHNESSASVQVYETLSQPNISEVIIKNSDPDKFKQVADSSDKMQCYRQENAASKQIEISGNGRDYKTIEHLHSHETGNNYTYEIYDRDIEISSSLKKKEKGDGSQQNEIGEIRENNGIVLSPDPLSIQSVGPFSHDYNINDNIESGNVYTHFSQPHFRETSALRPPEEVEKGICEDEIDMGSRSDSNKNNNTNIATIDPDNDLKVLNQKVTSPQEKALRKSIPEPTLKGHGESSTSMFVNVEAEVENTFNGSLEPKETYFHSTEEMDDQILVDNPEPTFISVESLRLEPVRIHEPGIDTMHDVTENATLEVNFQVDHLANQGFSDLESIENDVQKEGRYLENNESRKEITSKSASEGLRKKENEGCISQTIKNDVKNFAVENSKKFEHLDGKSWSNISDRAESDLDTTSEPDENVLVIPVTEVQAHPVEKQVLKEHRSCENEAGDVTHKISEGTLAKEEKYIREMIHDCFDKVNAIDDNFKSIADLQQKVNKLDVSLFSCSFVFY